MIIVMEAYQLIHTAYVVNDGCDTHLLTSLLSALLAIRPTVAVLRPSSYKPVEHLMTQFPTTGIIHDSNRIRQRGQSSTHSRVFKHC